MNLDKELKPQNPFRQEQPNEQMGEDNNPNFLQIQNNNNDEYDENNNPFTNNEMDQYSGYMNEASNIPNEYNNYKQQMQQQGYPGMEDNLQQYNQQLLDYEPNTMFDDAQEFQSQYQQALKFNQQYSNLPTEIKQRGLNISKQNQLSMYQTEQQLEKYEKVSEYLLQADNSSLNGIRNILTYQQNRNFLYNEGRCLEILRENNQIFNFDAYKCTMIVVGILIDAAISLIKDERYYLAEKYLLRAKSMTEPNEKHLRKINEENKNLNYNNNNDYGNGNNKDNRQISDEEIDQQQQEEEDMIFEKDIQYHDMRIEIALQLSNIYKLQMKNLKKKRKNQLKKKPVQFNQLHIENRFDGGENEIGGMKEIKEEHELEMEQEKYDNTHLNSSPPKFLLSHQQSPSKDKQVLFSSNIDSAYQPKQAVDSMKSNSKGFNQFDDKKDIQTLKLMNGNNKEGLSYSEQMQIQKQKEMDEEEEKEEEENQSINKMELAFKVLNEIESKFTDEYIELCKQDLKGTLCKFYQKKVEILNELLKYGESEYSENEIEEMSKEMLKCAMFVIGTLESILLPLKVSESQEEQADSVFLANILSYTWTKVGKYYLKINEKDKADQCYKNAYERLQEFFRDKKDHDYLIYKFKLKYKKFIGKIAFENVGEGDVIEYRKFQSGINLQNQIDTISANKKNYLTSSYGIPTTQNIQGVSGQFYIDPEYLNQLKSHHTIKSLNKHRHLKKIPIVHPFGSSITALSSQQQNTSLVQNINSPNALQSGRSFKFKKNLQLQLENYKNQILGMNSSLSSRVQPSNQNNFNNNSIQGSNMAPFGNMEFSIQPKTTGAQIELSPDEQNAPFIFPAKKVRQHPQSAKVRGASSAKRNQPNNEDYIATTATNLASTNQYQGQSNQQNQKNQQVKIGLHRKAPSLSNALTKVSSQNSGQKQLNEISKISNIVDEKLSNSIAAGFGLSYTSVPSSRREYASQTNNKKFINQNQDDPLNQKQLLEEKALFTSQGYFQQKNRKQDQNNSQQLSLEMNKFMQFGNQSKFPMSVSSSIMTKSILSPQQHSLHQAAANKQGFSSQKRVMSAKVPKQTNTFSSSNIYNPMQQINKLQLGNGIESDSLMLGDGLNNTNKVETLNSARNQNEQSKLKGSKQIFSRNNSVTNDMLDNIVQFVDSMYENPQKNNLNLTKSTASTSTRNLQNSKKQSSSTVYFSTSRLFSNTGSMGQLQTAQKNQNLQQDQTGIIYEGYEGNDQSMTQHANETSHLLQYNQQELLSNHQINNPYQLPNNSKKYNQQQGNRFIVVNQKPSKPGKNSEMIINTMGNLRLQLNNLFDSNNEVKIQQRNQPNVNAAKYSIKLNSEQKEVFIDLLSRRPTSKLDSNTAAKPVAAGQPARKNSTAQNGQNYQQNNHGQKEQEDENIEKQKQKGNKQIKQYQARNSIKLPQQPIIGKQVKSLTQFDDQSKKHQPSQQGIQQIVQEKRNEGSSRRINTVEKSNNRNKDMSLIIQQQQQGTSNQQQVGSSAFIQINQNNPNIINSNINSNNQQLQNNTTNKNTITLQNPSPIQKDKDNQNDAQLARNPITQSVTILKKKNTENYHDSSMISAQQPILTHNQVSNQENSRILKSGKNSDQVISNKSGLINNSKIEDKPIQKANLRRLSTNITESVFKRSPTVNYESNQINQMELPQVQTNNEDEKKQSGHFTTPFIKQKFDQFQNMNTGLINKDQNKINETQSSQEDDEEEVSEDQIRQLSQQMLDDLQQLNNLDDQRGVTNEDTNNNVGDELRKSDKRLGNSINLKVSQGLAGKIPQQSPDISHMMGSQHQQQVDNNKSFPHHYDQAPSSLQQSFYQQQQGNYFITSNNNNQSNQALHDKSITQIYPNLSTNVIQPMNISNVNKGITSSQNQGKAAQSSHNFNSQTQNKDQLITKTLYYPSIKEQKYKNLRKRIKELLFVPMYYYKSYNQYSLCQWNVTNISISLKSVCEEGDAENIEQLLQQFDKNNKKNKSGIPITSDKIRYDIKLSIFLECTVSEQHLINNPLIFFLKDQPLNYVDHLWPNDKQKIETKYEFAILLLDRWIKERDFNVVEELYNIELAYQNIQLQFVLRGGEHYSEFQKIIQMEQSQFGQTGAEKLDQIRIFGIKINFIINKIAQIVKRVHGDIIRIPIDMNEVNSTQLSIRQNNLQNLRSHQNKRRNLRNLISYYKMDHIDFNYKLQIQIQKFQRKKLFSHPIDYIQQNNNSEVIPYRERGERGQIRFDEQFIKSQQQYGEDTLQEDSQLQNYQKLPLQKGFSNESPVHLRNVDFNDLYQQKRYSTKEMYENSSNSNNQYAQIGSSGQQQNTSQSNNSNIPFLGPLQQQQFKQYQQQNQGQSFNKTSNGNPSLINRVSSNDRSSFSHLFVNTNQSSSENKSLLPSHSQAAKSQKYHKLRYKMYERVYEVKKDSDHLIPLETQVPLEILRNKDDSSNKLSNNSNQNLIEGNQESALQNTYNNPNISPSQRINILPALKNDNGEYSSSPRSYQNQQNPRIIMQGFSNAVEEQLLQGNSSNSPRNQASYSAHQRADINNNFDDSSLAMQEQSKQAEEYKKKYDLAAASAAANNNNSNNNNPNSINNPHLIIHPQSTLKQNNLRIDFLKRQVRDNIQYQQQSITNNNEYSQSQSESPRSAGFLNSQNNSFASSQQSSATSPTNIVGPNTLQRMPSLLSNKSSKSKFSRYAPNNNNEELNDSLQSPSQANMPQNKKSSQFARLNSKYESSDGQEDQSQKSPQLEPESDILEALAPIVNDDGIQNSQTKSAFVDQITLKNDRNQVAKDGEGINGRSQEQIEEEEEFSINNRTINECNFGDPYTLLPDSYKYQTFNLNPFYQTDLLLKTVIKRDRLFFFVQIFYSFESMLEQIIFYEQALNHSFFIIKTDSMMYKSGWDCEIVICFEQFIEKLIKPYTEFSFFKFLYTKGFSLKQKIAIKKGIERYLKVEDCQFVFDWDAPIQANNLSYVNPINNIMANDYILDENSNDQNDNYGNDDEEEGQEDNDEDEDDSVHDLKGYKNYIKILQQGKAHNLISYSENKHQKNKNAQKQKNKNIKFQSENGPTDIQLSKSNQLLGEQEFYKINQQQNEANLAQLNLILNRTNGQEKSKQKVSFNQSNVMFEQSSQVKINKEKLISNSAVTQYDINKIKSAPPKLVNTIHDTSIVEFKSNLDVKILAQQGLKKLNNYETPAREEDYSQTFNLLTSNDLIVLLKYVQSETKNYHQILIYKPLSNTPLLSQEITDSNILERFLNLKWLDSQVITLMKKSDKKLRRKLMQPHINQGLTSMDNLKKMLFKSLFQIKDQMNGQVINLRPIFSVENQRIRRNIFRSKNERLKNISQFLLENIQNKKAHHEEKYIEQSQIIINYKNEKNKSIRKFLQQMKYSIVTYDITDESQFQQNEIVHKYFEKKTVKDYGYINSHSQLTKFKVFIIMTVFRTQVHLNLQKIVYVRLDISPLLGQRNKLFKLVFDLSDITNLFERSFSFDNSFEDLLLFRIIQKISKFLVYSKTQVYKSFSLPLSKINPQQVDRHQFNLINRFSIQPPGHLIPKEISKRSFLDLVQQGERVVFQGVKRLLNTYAIVTIGYYTQLDYYYIQIYLPHNCRKFTNTFYTSNLANLSGEFMNQIFKEKIAKNNLDELIQQKDYHSYSKRICKLDPTKQGSSIQQNNQKQQQQQQQLGNGLSNFGLKSSNKLMQNTIEESMESSYEQKQTITHSYVNPNVFLDLIKPNNMISPVAKHNFIELNIWEEITKNVDIQIDSNGELLFTMDNYSGIMREYLNKSIINFSANQNGLFEVLVRFRDSKLKQDLQNSPQIQIHDSDEIKLDMYVRINFFQKVNSINEKILLRQILFSYYNQNLIKFRNIPKEQNNQHNYINLLSPSANDGNQIEGGYDFNGNLQHHNYYNNQQENYSPSPLYNNNFNNHANNNNIANGEEISPYINFSECVFNHSDLINVSHLLLDRIRTSIQVKQSQIMKFYDHQNELFQTGEVEQNYNNNDPPPLPHAQLQATQNVASAYLNFNELLQEPASILKKNLNSSKIISQVGTNVDICDTSYQQKSVKKIASNHTLDQTIIDQKYEFNLVNQLVGGLPLSEKQIRKKNECMVDKKARKKIKMNNNININELLDSENKQLYMKTLYRGIFTVKPLQIIAIFYYKKFYVQIYNTINGKNLITDLSFSTVEHQIPYLQHMLVLELYQEIGRRIFLSFKNRLMIKSYPKLIDY